MTQQDPIPLFVDKLRRRTALTPEEIEALLGLHGNTLTIGANRDFVSLGQHVTEACLIVEGLVARFGQARDGSRQISALYIPGDMPDLHSVILPKAIAALHALTPTTVLQVPHSQIAALSGRYPGIAEALWRDCAVDADIATEWLFSIGRKNARSRVAHLLCEMSWRYAKVTYEPNPSFNFPITQSNFADAIGITPVHVNRTLRDLRNERIVSVRGQEVTIQDLAALIRVAEFDADYLWLDMDPLRLTPTPPSDPRSNVSPEAVLGSAQALG